MPHTLADRLVSALSFGGNSMIGSLAALLVLVAAEVVLVIVFMRVASGAWQIFLKQRFRRDYGIQLSKAIRIKRHLKAAPSNGYSLTFPRWLYPNKDGSQDHRRTKNGLQHFPSKLCVGHYEVRCPEPLSIVWLANALRRKGVEVARTELENQKFYAVQHQKERHAQGTSIEAIYSLFIDSPTDFEEYCADLYRHEGYRAKTTSRTRDGGYDIEMIDPQQRRCIVECKCYRPGHAVDRPTVQKLQGAADVLRPDRVIFVTTSTFTPDAREYARRMGIELVDGSLLLIMAERRNLSLPRFSDPALEEWLLTYEDLLPSFPPDAAPAYLAL